MWRLFLKNVICHESSVTKHRWSFKRQIKRVNQLKDTELEVEQKKRQSMIKYTINRFKADSKIMEVPVAVGSESLFTSDIQSLNYPHEHKRRFAQVSYGNRKHMEIAINSALAAQSSWCLQPAEERLSIWRKCADYIEENPSKIIATIVLGMGKIIQEADEDVRRIVSSIRSNADYLEHLSKLRFEIQGDVNVFPTFKLRPMDGFIAAIGPLESAALSVNLALCPALMGNTVIWSPRLECAPTCYLIFQALKLAGLPDGVLNFVPANERLFLDNITDSVHFAGLNYHGDANNFKQIFKQVGDKINRFICFPRLVCECQGKNFHFIHRSADLETVIKSTISAAFDFAGQSGSSCSRVYVPSSMWEDLRTAFEKEVNKLKMGDPSLPSTEVGPIINSATFERIKLLIDQVQHSNKTEIVCGGEYDSSTGFFVKPTIAVVYDPLDPLLSEPIQGPFLPVFVYADDSLTEALKLAAQQSKYALSGSIFATKDDIICHALNILRMAASNIYINERCTGNFRGLTPFGGNRLSGSNDKSGSAYFLMRWSSPLLIEETINNSISICAKCNCVNCFSSACSCGD